jgi:hypothetical protein
VETLERGKLGVESSQSRASAGSTCLSVTKVPPDYTTYIPPILGDQVGYVVTKTMVDEVQRTAGRHEVEEERDET